ncbi:hypothetical protein RND71_017626 [Anisodus tanguticus]|uniref:Uncharacterized protein n=1 Tax=Anisodus tanguticus TaxID=243964 RepID=A0AAE1S2R3_9SOLA|nr:hypothetical protein RND71_017626 [Anisodus tanguticus]
MGKEEEQDGEGREENLKQLRAITKLSVNLVSKSSSHAPNAWKICLSEIEDMGVVTLLFEIDGMGVQKNKVKGRLDNALDTWHMFTQSVACVLMFHLQRDDFPVDAHIFQIAKTLRWVPAAADVKKTYLRLNWRIPDELKFDLNCLIYTHGKVCRECSGKGSNKPKKERDKLCPLLCQSSNSIKGQPRALSSRYARGPRKGRTTRVYCTQSYLTFLQEVVSTA